MASAKPRAARAAATYHPTRRLPLPVTRATRGGPSTIRPLDSFPWGEGSLLGVLLQPGRDFLAERLLEDAGDVVGLLDLDHRPVLAYLLQRLDVEPFDEVV